MDLASRFYNTKSREICKLSQNVEFFYLKFYISLPGLDNFGQREYLVL
jgi:hypothetical protein